MRFHPLAAASLKAAAMLLAVSALTSCGTDDPAKETHTATFTDYFTYAVSPSQASVPNSGTVGSVDIITLEFNDNDKEAAIELRGLVLDNTTRNDRVRFENLKYTADADGVRKLSVSGPTTSADGKVTVDNLRMTYYPKHIPANSDLTYHGLSLHFNTGSLAATFIPRKGYGTGATEITTKATGSKYVTTVTSYEVEIDPADGKARFSVLNPDFSPQMPRLGTMVFGPGDDTYNLSIAFVDGGYSLSEASINPSIAGVPYPRFVITGFSYEADMTDNSADISFTCAGAFEVNAETTALYTVTDPEQPK